MAILEGPTEAHLHMNTFLQPIVEQLIDGIDGFDLATSRHGVLPVKFRLFCLSMDIPAMRKCAGFLSHAAGSGCSKCYVKFEQRDSGNGGTRQDCSDTFELDAYPARTREGYDEAVRKILAAETPTARSKLEKKEQQRYSILSELPDFDIVRYAFVVCRRGLVLWWLHTSLGVRTFHILKREKPSVPAAILFLMKLPAGEVLAGSKRNRRIKELTCNN